MNGVLWQETHNRVLMSLEKRICVEKDNAK